MWAGSGIHQEDDEPTEANVGRFIPRVQLLQWHKQMKMRFPDIYTADDKLFGSQDCPHAFGTKLKTYFDGDPNKPMRCELVGSRWQVEYGGMREPMYVVLMGHELTQIPLTSAHEEGGWQVDGSACSSDEEEEDDDDEDSVAEEQGRDQVSESAAKADTNVHKIEQSSSIESIQNIINAADVNDIIELPKGEFRGDSPDAKLDINKNLTFRGEGLDETVLVCHLTLKQGDGCSGGKVLIRKLKVKGKVTVTDNTFDDVKFEAVEVSASSNVDAMTIEKCPGKLLLLSCEITGGSDGLSLLDRTTRAKIYHTDISYAASRGIFANPGFDIEESAVYNCGGYGIKGRGGWNDLGGNTLQPGPWNSFGGY